MTAGARLPGTAAGPAGARLARLAVAAPLAVSLLLATACVSDDDGGDDGAAAGETAPTAPGDVATGLFERIPEIVRAVQPSVVAILTDRGEGSGVVWAGDGTIVTNDHVVAGAARIEVVFADGRRADATALATDPLTDLALVRVERTGLPAATFADDVPEVGELAIAMGNPLGFENTVTAGIVSGLHRSIPGSATPSLVDLIQTDAPISPGNSGGALVDGAGRVVGINVAYIPPSAQAVSLGFAIPAPTVRDVVGQLLEDGTVSHAYLGIVPAQLTPQIAEQLSATVDAGVLVLDVVAGGPAASAGVLEGDIIVRAGGEDLETVEELLGLLRREDPGGELRLEVVRGAAGGREAITVTLSDRPSP